MGNIITRSLTLKGFTLGGYLHLAGEFQQHMAGWFGAGKIAHDETVVEGIDHAVDAFLGLLRGENVGKMVVKILRACLSVRAGPRHSCDLSLRYWWLGTAPNLGALLGRVVWLVCVEVLVRGMGHGGTPRTHM